MFDQINLKELGNMCRRKRKELGFTMEELEDEQISVSTISNIERGVPIVSHQKIEYYCVHKLKLNISDYNQLSQQERKLKLEKEEELWFIERLIEQGNPDEGLTELKKFNLSGFRELEAMIFYLKGRAYYYKNQWEQARKNFLRTIEFVDKYPQIGKSNIASICYNDLGRINFFYYGNLKNALQYTELGISCFNPDGERYHILYTLKICQVLYLEKLNRIQDAYQTVKELWKCLDQIDYLDVVLNTYEMRAKLLFKMKRFDDAIYTAKKGLEISTLNKSPERTLELITTLGSIYLKLNQLNNAEKCFLEGLNLKNQIAKKYLFITTFTQIGILYMKKKQFEKAQSYLKVAVEIGQKSPDVVRYAQSLTELGVCHLAQHDISKASDIFLQALSVAKNHSLYYKASQILTKLTKLWEHRDEEKFNMYMAELFRFNLLLDEEQ
ncbi:tetratricopeptide repeat protein [Seinonella peptonophila]|nr:tetratricopeptide repeat protein [Seinonella peptonophila]